MEYLNNNDKELIIWTDANIYNNENRKYLLQLGYSNINLNHTNTEMNFISQNEKNLPYEIQIFTNIASSISFIKTLRFRDTFIIISGSLYEEFISQLRQNLIDIYIIPDIIIFTSRKRNFSAQNNKFFNFLGEETTFEKVRRHINSFVEKMDQYNQLNQFESNNIKNNFQEHLIFEQIINVEMMFLPILYRNILEKSDSSSNKKFIKFLCDECKNEPKYYKLLNLISLENLPVELLCKYYSRIYTIEGSFYKDMKTVLLGDDYKKQQNYLPFIKTLYDGLKLKALKPCMGRVLYSAQYLSAQDINNLYEYQINKLPDLPMSIVFSKSFLSFSKDKNEALKFFNYGNKNALFRIIGAQGESNLLSQADIEEISCIPSEREVLFFPFCAFGINNFKYDLENNRYEVELIFLGNYKGIYDKLIGRPELDNIIPESKFKNFFKKSGLVNENKLNKMKMKDLSEAHDQKKEKHKKKCFIGIFIVVVVLIVIGIFVVSFLAQKKSTKSTNSTKVDSNLISYNERNIECDSGYYLEKDKKICSICPAGSYSQKGAEECIKCPNGTYSDFNGASSCEECSVGTIPNNEKTSCIKCPVGTYSNIKGASKCIPCPINTYSDEQGAIECKKCESGFCSNPGSVSCHKC